MIRTHRISLIAIKAIVLQIAIFLFYVVAGLSFAASRLSRFSKRHNALVTLAFVSAAIAIIWHAQALFTIIFLPNGLALTLSSIVSLIGLQLAFTAFLGAFEPSLRGLSGGLLLPAAITGAITGIQMNEAAEEFTWQLQSHILISLFAYGLLTVGAIVACYALIQDWRLRSGRLSAINQLFAPLETTEKLLYGVAALGFTGLLLSVVTGVAFVDNLFAQHLAHKTFLSLIALALFGVLLAGRQFAGWRGRKAVFLYFAGFVFLCLAYFGSRIILEMMLGRHWG